MGKIVERQVQAIVEEEEDEEGNDEEKEKSTSVFGLGKLKKIVLRQGVSDVMNSANETIFTEA